jgi:hypothetical protein
LSHRCTDQTSAPVNTFGASVGSGHERILRLSAGSSCCRATKARASCSSAARFAPVSDARSRLPKSRNQRSLASRRRGVGSTQARRGGSFFIYSSALERCGRRRSSAGSPIQLVLSKRAGRLLGVPNCSARHSLASSDLWSRGVVHAPGLALFFLEARVIGRDALRALKLVKSNSVPLVSRVCDQFCLCKFVECDQRLLTFGCAIVCRKNPPF